jgi:hypothetical protein
LNRKRILWAAGLSLALLLFWSWRRNEAAKLRQEQALLQAYVDESLHYYALSATRAVPAVKGRAKADWKEISSAAAASQAALEKLLPTAAAGTYMAGEFRELQPVLERWAKLGASQPSKAQALAWLEEERQLRGKVLFVLESIRYEAQEQWRLSRQRFLELNALIYSLKELNG